MMIMSITDTVHRVFHKQLAIKDNLIIIIIPFINKIKENLQMKFKKYILLSNKQIANCGIRCIWVLILEDKFNSFNKILIMVDHNKR